MVSFKSHNVRGCIVRERITNDPQIAELWRPHRDFHPGRTTFWGQTVGCCENPSSTRLITRVVICPMFGRVDEHWYEMHVHSYRLPCCEYCTSASHAVRRGTA